MVLCIAQIVMLDKDAQRDLNLHLLESLNRSQKSRYQENNELFLRKILFAVSSQMSRKSVGHE